jgi:hypothetical protein
LDPQCVSRFPLINGIPILINEARSLFSLDDFLTHQGVTFRQQPQWERFLANIIPELGVNFKAEQNYKQFVELLARQSKNAKVLVIGAGELGRGM